MPADRTTRASAAGRCAAVCDWFAEGWRVVHWAAQILVLSLTLASYRGAQRVVLARHLVADTAPVLPWFLVLSSLLSLVIIRIVLVTAESYGLSRYALEMLVRVLVLELLPLAAAIFVTLRVALPNAAEIAALRIQRAYDAAPLGEDLLRREVLPRALSGLFAMLLTTAVSCVVTALLAYWSVYGFTVAGVPAYTRTFGQVFAPAVSLIFAAKTLFFGLAVALLPLATVLAQRRGRRRASVEQLALVRLFLALLAIEAASLIGNYS